MKCRRGVGLGEFSLESEKMGRGGRVTTAYSGGTSVESCSDSKLQLRRFQFVGPSVFFFSPSQSAQGIGGGSRTSWGTEKRDPRYFGLAIGELGPICSHSG